MILRTNYFDVDDNAPVVISTSPTQADIVRAIESLDWSRLASVILHEDEHNWFDGSGSLDPETGLSMMLETDSIQYVTETAPPNLEWMVEPFFAFLEGDFPRLFGYIYDAHNRGLSAGEVERLRSADEARQRQSIQKHAAIAEANSLFSRKEYSAVVAILEPFESMLTPAESKKLALARKKLDEGR